MTRGFLIAIVALLLCLMGLSCGAPPSIERILGTELPSSAQEIRVTKTNAPSTTVTRLWALIEMPEADARKLAFDLRMGAATPPYGILLPVGGSEPDWWRREISGLDPSSAFPNQWMKANGNLRPGVINLLWNGGKLFIYFHGIVGSGTNAPLASNTATDPQRGRVQ